MKKAFTLIELLVVIAIIAILAAILFPVFAQAKEAAKKTTCLSNNKQMATAVQIYASDYDDMLCQTSWESKLTAQTFNPGGTYQIHWTFLMQPYMKNWQMFSCPSDPKPVTAKNPCPNGVADIGKLNGSGLMYCDWQAPTYSYIPNYNMMPAHDWLPVSLTAIEFPAQTIALTERRNTLKNGFVIGQQKGLSGFNPSQPCPGSTKVAPQYAPLTGTTNYAFWTRAFAEQHLAVDTTDKNDIVRVAWERHSNGAATYSYIDGHAKVAKLDQVLNPDAYQFGDTFLPAYAPYNTTACVN
ncbi:MAG: prepilin-type N-terminal cleavage/methylation domain-containing protein [Fimbriimonadaceae bacterium]